MTEAQQVTDRLAEVIRRVFGAQKETQASRNRAKLIQRAVAHTPTDAMNAAFGRQMRHNTFFPYRRNTRGLPIGVGVHDYAAALDLKKFLSCRPADDERAVSDCRLNAADSVLDQVKDNRELRQKHPKRSKLARRIGHGHNSNRPAFYAAGDPPTLVQPSGLQVWCGRHTAKMMETRRQGRVPYARPTALQT